MEQYMKQLRQRHKLLSYFLGLGVIIFFNCFGFPIINLNKEWSMMLTAIKIYVVLGGALFSGGILAGLFPKKKPFFIILITSITVGLGLLCRYLLEFGEVSNTYNFTVPNTLLHVGIFLALTGLTYISYIRKK